MALLKNVITRNGAQATYHKITAVNLRGNQLTCVINSYASEDYRKKELPLENIPVLFSITIEEEESMGIRQLCYKKIKELPMWSDAEDC